MRIIREDALKGSAEVALMECIGSWACQCVDGLEDRGLKWTIRKVGGDFHPPSC